MTKWLCALFLLAPCGVSCGALATNFAASYGRYQACAVVMGTSKCYKLYCDPAGIVAGQLTAFIDIPNNSDEPRLNGVREIEDVHPLYNVTLGNTSVFNSPGRERTESTIAINALDPLNPATGQAVLFSYESGDKKDFLGV